MRTVAACLWICTAACAAPWWTTRQDASISVREAFPSTLASRQPRDCVLAGAPRPEWSRAVVDYINSPLERPIVRSPVPLGHVVIGDSSNDRLFDELTGNPALVVDLRDGGGQVILFNGTQTDVYCVGVEARPSATTLVLDLSAISLE